MLESINVTTRARSEMIDITSQVHNVIATSGKNSSMCQVFVTHTTAGITINEKADPDVRADIIAALDQTYPWKNNYRHLEGNSAAHIKSSLIGSSVLIPIQDSRLVLGTWQCIFFCEFDGPRTRSVVVNVM